ncbi:hypothetical protein B5V01_16555 [Mesorhizobium erdmanii]|uniref:Fe-S hydro-lyase tartrate dehydratase beta-type catalytic domain-containing protein n=1 Tax=Mesorhizobium erdmanii TaxID=1777866 RepID=A0A4Q1V153_9HYPH|nr:hypothetical protein B5V01_16555 [Mesorhizobium erdmanii]
MVGKAERSPAAIESTVRHKTPYLIAVGGAAYLISTSIKAARLVANDVMTVAIVEKRTTVSWRLRRKYRGEAHRKAVYASPIFRTGAQTSRSTSLQHVSMNLRPSTTVADHLIF